MSEGTEGATSDRISPLQRTVEERITTPVLRVLLRSRFHWLASRWLVLVSYEGRRTGQRYTFPVVYDRRGDSLVVVTPMRESDWWKNFVEPRRCSVRLHGTERPVIGELVTDENSRLELLEGYLETHGLVGRLLDVPDATDRPTDRDVWSIDALDVVRFFLQTGVTGANEHDEADPGA